ncbi:hypothetical protein [Bifidobacterium hapali]|uniref:hypothetical protein n=1 Tax=Bifidobacterium hapali TaxID=1630172 RepID=UPI000B9B5427|nr:hypothetical protein [Bifidobacterium hapali]
MRDCAVGRGAVAAWAALCGCGAVADAWLLSLNYAWQKTLADGGLSERFLPLTVTSGGFCSLIIAQ